MKSTKLILSAYGILLLVISIACGEPTNGFPFTRLPLEVREKAGVYDSRSSGDTDNPFGFFAHNELPDVELVRLMADMGMGHAKLPQSNPDVFVPLADKLGMDVIVHSWLPRHPDRFRALVKKHGDKIRYFQTDGDEPNNSGTKPEDFVKRMSNASSVFRTVDTEAKLIMDDLGDVRTAKYMKQCLDAGLAEYVDYVSYGYFTWGHSRNLSRAITDMVNDANEKKGKDLKVFFAPLQQFGTGGFAVRKQQKHLIDFFWRGAELINIYKFIDWAGQFGLLDIDGSLSSGYAGFQNLCQFIGFDVPPDHKLKVAVSEQKGIPDAWKGTDGLLPVETGYGYGKKGWRLWIRPFSNNERLFITYWSGAQHFGWRSHAPSGYTATFSIASDEYAYPVSIDMVTGRIRDLPHSISKGKIVIRNVPIDSYARAILLLKRHPEWEHEEKNRIDARERKLSSWHTVTDMKGMPGDWVTAILPDNRGGAWIGLCALEHDKNTEKFPSVAYLSKNLGVRKIPFRSNPSKKFFATYTRRMVKLLRNKDIIYGVTHGHSKGAKGGVFSFEKGAEFISDYYSPSEKDPTFSTLGFTDMIASNDDIWLTAIGTFRESGGGSDLGEGVARFDTKNGTWRTYRHHREDELTGGKPTKGTWADRCTAVLSEGKRIWVASMGADSSCFDGAAWQRIDRTRGAYTLSYDGKWIWMGADKGNVYRARDITTPADEDLLEIQSKLSKKDSPDTPDMFSGNILGDDAVEFEEEEMAHREFKTEAFNSSTTGLKGRILHSASEAGRTWFATRYQGVAMVDKDGKWKTWLPGNNGLPEDMIEGILPVKDHVWVWTWGGGIARMNLKEGVWKKTTRRNGLVDNRVSTLVEDKNGAVWVGTFRGVSVKR